MSSWALQNEMVKGDWESVFDRALAGEPQFLTRDGERAVVVMSIRSYEAGTSKRKRTIVKNPKLACVINDEDMFSDDSDIWETCGE